MAFSPTTEMRCADSGAAASSAPAARSRSAATSDHVHCRESSASATSCGAASALARIAAVTRAPSKMEDPVLCIVEVNCSPSQETPQLVAAPDDDWNSSPRATKYRCRLRPDRG